MILAAEKILKDFCLRHPQASGSLQRWSYGMKSSDFKDYSELKRMFASADYVAPFTIFNLAGNNYRVVARVDYRNSSVVIRWVLTHADYDKWTKKFRQGKVRL